MREVRFTFSRFLSILVLSALAVAFLAGLRTTAPDMEYTADNYYDRTHLMDGYAISTLGLTGDDLAALAQADGVSAVEGSWTLDATAEDAVVAVRSMPETLNLLEVTEGRLPQAAGQSGPQYAHQASKELEPLPTLAQDVYKRQATGGGRVRYGIHAADQAGSGGGGYSGACSG